MGEESTLLQVLGIASTIGVGVLAWSLRKNLVTIETAVVKVETDMRQLTATVGGHGESLAKGGEKFQQLERRMERFEDRERERCNRCRFEGGA